MLQSQRNLNLNSNLSTYSYVIFAKEFFLSSLSSLTQKMELLIDPASKDIENETRGLGMMPFT
jgi:hypothetical protein